MGFPAEVGVAVAVLLAGVGLWADWSVVRAKPRLGCPVCCEVVEPEAGVCPRCTNELAAGEHELDVALALRELAYRRERYAKWSQMLVVSSAVLLILSLLGDRFLG